MIPYSKLSAVELIEEHDSLYAELERTAELGLNLNMSRGKPSSEQLDLSTPMLGVLESAEDCYDGSGTDCRNYGVLEGIQGARELGALMLDDRPENVLVLGNSSLNVMYDTISRCFSLGCLGERPWAKCDEVKFICPAPGYDRHFAILEQFGIKMISVPMTGSGPCMDTVEGLVGDDASIKGIWCVPKYSNPTGVTYSDDTVRRLASMECAASDFRIFWDNAYCVHDLYPEDRDRLLDIAKACIKAGNPNRYFKFASTSKITFPGAGISFFSSSDENISQTRKHVSAQTIGADKLTQLRHIRFLPDRAALSRHMDAHAEILRPKFELVDTVLGESLEGLGIASWTKPKGGYFISFNGMRNTAKRTVELAGKAGAVFTKAGATYPYGKDPKDSNIRIAPSMPSMEDLRAAMGIFALCAKIAALERLMR